MVGQGPGGLANPFPMRTRLLPSDAAAVDVALGRGKETPQYCSGQPDQRDGTGRHRWTLLQVTALSGTTWTSWMRARLPTDQKVGGSNPFGRTGGGPLTCGNAIRRFPAATTFVLDRPCGAVWCCLVS